VDVRVGGTFTYESKSSSAFEDDDDDDVAIAALSSNTDDEQKHHRLSEESVLPTNNRMLFIAGGVGINPLYSMIRQWSLDQTHAKTKETNTNNTPRAVLLYSGGSRESLLFVKELEQLMNGKPDQFRVVFTTTTKGQNGNGAANNASINGENRGNLSGGESSGGTIFTEGRIDSVMIGDAVNWLNHSKNMAEKSKQQQQRELPQKQPSTKIADAVFVCGPPGMPESMMDILSEEKLVQSTDNVHFEKWW